MSSDGKIRNPEFEAKVRRFKGRLRQMAEQYEAQEKVKTPAKTSSTPRATRISEQQDRLLFENQVSNVRREELLKGEELTWDQIEARAEQQYQKELKRLNLEPPK